MGLHFSLPSFLTALRKLEWKWRKWDAPCFVHHKGPVSICMQFVINEKSPGPAIEKCVFILTFPLTASFLICQKIIKEYMILTFLARQFFLKAHLLFWFCLFSTVSPDLGFFTTCCTVPFLCFCKPLQSVRPVVIFTCLYVYWVPRRRILTEVPQAPQKAPGDLKFTWGDITGILYCLLVLIFKRGKK